VVRSTILALLAAAAVATGCGARSEQIADSPAQDAPGILVFSGVTSGSYLHAMRPDGTDLVGVALPETCSPEGFTRDGRVLTCFNLGDDSWEHSFIAFEREGSAWRRVPLPQATRFPDWVDWATGGETDGDAEEGEPAWAPNGKHIAVIRDSGSATCCWFSVIGDVAVADVDGGHEQVIAENGQAPAWSPDGTRLAFARCRISEANYFDEKFDEDIAECSLWTVAADGSDKPSLLVDETASPPVWSPDGRFVAFFRESGTCETFCRHQIFIVPAGGGKPRPVGSEVVEPSDGHGEWWPGLAWLPEKAPVIVPIIEKESDDVLELQRCVDIWNRAHMRQAGPVNVSLVGDRCQITVRDYGGICWQTPKVPYRYFCPSHGGPLRLMPPEYRVWNAHASNEGTLTLFDAPKGPRLPLPKAPPYPMLDGEVIPYGKDGEPLAGLKLAETDWTCDAWGGSDDPVVYCSVYDECFKRPGRLAVGDIVLCPSRSARDEAYDPMHFEKVEVAKVG
jgi:hypothetical protein